ncbi:MAG: Ig-like domain-containing protein [Ruminiclostridium sp.]|nr:Ig-like domain-containing protein [Ruminiclostridium sp.]
MRYDDYDDYNRRSSRSGSRSSSGRSSGSREYSSRDYDRSYGGYDRGYSGYDRGYSSYDSYDRDYNSYDRDYRSSDRYGSRNRGRYDDFDQKDWARTAPNWDDRSGARRKSGSRSSSYDNRSRSGSGSRSRSQSGRGGPSSGRRPPERRNSSRKKKKSIPVVPIILGVVLVVLAVLVVKSFFGKDTSNYAIELASQTIVVGESTTATITGLSAAEEYEITWGSSENNVVSVDGNGATCKLTAKKEGSATIAATVDGETLQKTVMVVDVAPGVVGIKVTEETVEIKSGDSYAIQATVEMESDNMSPAKITWSSSDTSVARVDSSGVVTGRDVGTAIIKGTAGEKTVEIVIKVVENPDNATHDESENTGTEPEEGAEKPDNGNTGGGGNTNTGGTGTGENGTGTGENGGTTTGGTETATETTEGTGTGDGTGTTGGTN